MCIPVDGLMSNERLTLSPLGGAALACVLLRAFPCLNAESVDQGLQPHSQNFIEQNISGTSGPDIPPNDVKLSRTASPPTLVPAYSYKR